MSEETTALLVEKLEILATKLGTTAEMLWEVLVRQAYVDALSWSIVPLMLILGLSITTYLFNRWRIKFNNDYELEDMFFVGTVASTILLCISVLVVFFYAIPCKIIPGFLNPEYIALQKILEIF